MFWYWPPKHPPNRLVSSLVKHRFCNLTQSHDIPPLPLQSLLVLEMLPRSMMRYDMVEIWISNNKSVMNHNHTQQIAKKKTKSDPLELGTAHQRWHTLAVIRGWPHYLLKISQVRETNSVKHLQCIIVLVKHWPWKAWNNGWKFETTSFSVLTFLLFAGLRWYFILIHSFL